MARRCIVVGGGVIGLCVADALLDRGLEVTVLERDPRPGHSPSFGNGGLIVPSHFEPLANPGALKAGLGMLGQSDSAFGVIGWGRIEVLAWIARFAWAACSPAVSSRMPVLRDLHLASRRLFEKLAEEMPAFDYEQRGVMMLCQTQDSLTAEREVADQAQTLGLEVRELEPADISRMHPGLRFDAVGAVWIGDDAQLDPGKFMLALRERVQKRGAKIQDGVEVDSLLMRNGRVVSAASHEADEFVLAAGVGCAAIGRSIGIRLPILGGKGYTVDVEGAQGPTIPLILPDARVAVNPAGGHIRFVGTMELGAQDTTITKSRLQGMLSGIASALPDFDLPRLETATPWAGLRPCSPDGMPLIGRSTRCQNLHIATGHAMIGLSTGPITGQLIAESICDEPPSIHSPLLSPNRF